VISKEFTLLYVEDSGLMREYVRKILEDKVKELYFAEDGKVGLDMFTQHKPDIILSDINMPNLNGLEMSKTIKESHKNQPIILLTEFEKVANLKQAIEIGISSFLSKPIQKGELIETITAIAEDLQMKRDAQKFKELELQRDKIQLLISMMKEIGHHWRQPLSAILSLSSSYELKKRSGLYISEEEEINDINMISEKIKELSAVLSQVQSIDFETVTISDIEQIIKVSDPIYS
jgi:YesN/AraC family two-component response regulator